MKYIDSDLLRKEIERLRSQNKELLQQAPSIGREFLFGISGAYSDVLKIIDSLQQEPRFPQYDNIVDKVFGAGNLEGFEYREAEMLVALAKEELLKSFQQEQPEVDLEKEIDDYFCSIERWQVEEEPYRQLDKCARHFYELGLNARKEENE